MTRKWGWDCCGFCSNCHKKRGDAPRGWFCIKMAKKSGGGDFMAFHSPPPTYTHNSRVKVLRLTKFVFFVLCGSRSPFFVLKPSALVFVKSLALWPNIKLCEIYGANFLIKMQPRSIPELGIQKRHKTP